MRKTTPQECNASPCVMQDRPFDKGSHAAERSTRLVMWITAVMMIIEIATGWWFNSMALLADGWHMSSHALAIGLSAFAYAAARKYAKDPRFAFGTWKIEILAGFTSALFLLVIGALMAVGSVERLLSPQPIHYREAIVVGLLGLTVNVICAIVLGGAHHHPEHDHQHDHHGDLHHDHGHHDLNLKAAYVHVLADAATSLLAVAALIGGWLYGWAWLDPVMGIVGAALVAIWAKNLLMDTGKVLLDREMDAPVVEEIKEVIETNGNDMTRIIDLHVWRVGRSYYSCALSVLTSDLQITADRIREKLSVHEEIIHSTIEVHYR